MSPARSIGGFIGLEAPGQAPALLFDAEDTLLFRNARAGLAHLLGTLKAPRVWVPAYVCPEVVEVARLEGRKVRFYGVGQALVADAAVLASEVRPGDVVIGVDYFGAPAQGLPSGMDDVTWIQDRAQGLWPAPRVWGDYLLYSPRKVVGVPDGGVLVSRRGPLPAPAWREDGSAAHVLPAVMRFEDPDGAHQDAWFPAYRQAERDMTAEPLPMSRLGQGLLGSIDVAAAADRRRANAARLLQELSEWALWPADRLLAGTPLGVPVLTDDAAEVAARMAARGIYCARHWPSLASPAEVFPEEHELSRRLLTLPCDQRYGADEMARVATAFRACLR